VNARSGRPAAIFRLTTRQGTSVQNVDNTQPFGSQATLVKTFPVDRLAGMYVEKCGLDVRRHFSGLREISLYECPATGMRFWRPISIAGDRQFYEEISRLFANYYKTDRWEYSAARAAIDQPDARVLEVGCGQGYFLQSLEPLGHTAVGLELNDPAIVNKVTRFEVRRQLLEDVALTEPASFDAVCSFQVLEHVIDPRGFIEACVRVVRPGGKIILSTPNYEHPIHADCQDPFDMPPHHVNHFTAQTYARIADILGLELLTTDIQTDTAPRLQVRIHDRLSPVERRLRVLLNSVLRATAGKKRTVGRNILAVLATPADGPT